MSMRAIPRRPDGRMPQLDSLRALAVFAVFVEHFFHSGHPVRDALPWGMVGVRLFFVLSGYLITRILLAARDAIEDGRSPVGTAVRHFYLRRFLRLMPVYYLYLMAAVLLLPQSRHYMPAFLSYTQNFLFARDYSIFTSMLGHFWTLAVEEQFYLIWPVAIFFFPRRWLPACITGTVVAGLATRIVGVALGFREVQVDMMMPAHFDTLGMGGLLAISEASTAARARLLLTCGWLGWPLLVASVVAPRFGAPQSAAFVVSEFGAGLAFTWVIGRVAVGCGGVVGRVLDSRILIYLGTISYGLYVYHFNVPGLLREKLFPRLGLAWPASQFVRFAVCASVTVVVASVSWYAIERPINRLKDRFRTATARDASSLGAAEVAAPAEPAPPLVDPAPPRVVEHSSV